VLGPLFPPLPTGIPDEIGLLPQNSQRTACENKADITHLSTSHSSQGQTADRVLVHVDTEQAGEKLVNRRLAYVAVSRRYDAQLYTNDKGQLAEQLSRDVSHRSAMEPGHAQQPPPQQTERLSAPGQAQTVAAQAQSIGH
jgi:ATP-dependent exoDNAse (exonuclease V) alpha subunit